MLAHSIKLALFLGVSAMPAFAQNADHIAKVQNGQSCAECNLFQADLTYKDAEKIDLSGARLRQSSLALTTFDDVNFSGANLSVSNLYGARFNRSDFRQANLQNVVAVGAYFGASNLNGADLSGANLSGADLSLAIELTQTQLNQACGDSSTRLPNGKTIPSCV
ncbi:MAG: pentapeptide repeat-containing protein [Henriciella sp.]|nr:pentapeptide repeat-containing protein [Henriciella sp.]